MSAGRWANLALALAITGWLLALYGVLSQMGDPSPAVSRSVIEGHRHASITALLLGFIGLLSSLWLSGATFAHAKKRSVLAAALVAVPAIAVIVDLY